MSTQGPATHAGRRGTSALDAFFRPRGVAIAGASNSPGKPGHAILSNLLEAGYPGHIAVIHPRDTRVLGMPAYPDLDAVPGPVELLVLAVPAGITGEMMEQLARRNRHRSDVKVVVAIAGGYAETGTADGQRWQDELVEGCRAAGVRLVGPNCLGIIDCRSRLDTTFLTGVHRAPSGISVVSQSGAMGAWMALEWSAQPLPIGLSKFVSLGNSADVDIAEVLDHLAQDNATRAIGLYLEGSSRARAVIEAAGAAAGRKPVVVLKVGRTGGGQAAVQSHTGALAGADALYDGAFQQFGLIRMDRVDDFAVALNAFDKLPLPLGGRIAVLSNAGGPGVYALDALADRGLLPAAFSPSSRAALTAHLPSYAIIGEPAGYVDMTGGVCAAQVAQAVGAALRDPQIDAVFHLFVPTRFTPAEEVAAAFLRLLPGLKRHSLDKPFFPVLLAGHGVARARRMLEENGIPTFGSPDQAAAALSAMVRYSQFRQPSNPSAVPSVGNQP